MKCRVKDCENYYGKTISECGMTKYDIIRIAKEVGLPTWYQDNALANESLIVKFAALIEAAEREACAKVAESYEPKCDTCPSGVSNAIRARREQ